MRILLTGAAGRIGRAFFEATMDQYDFRLTDKANIDISVDGHEVVQGDLTDPDFAQSLAMGCDAIVHLAGTADPDANFDVVMAMNVLPTKHLLDAAVVHGVERFIFASSAQTIEGYSIDRQIKPTDPVRPANYYGVGKAMGEALCAYYAVSHNIETISLRIGAYEPIENPALNTLRDYSAWLSPRDGIHLINRALKADIFSPLIVNGISNNRFKRLDIDSALSSIGFEPMDDAFSVFEPSLKLLLNTTET